MDRKSDQIKQLSFQTINEAGILITTVQKKDEIQVISERQRDNNYLLFFAFKGNFIFKIDFEDVELEAPFILKIEPHQVHQIVASNNAIGWKVEIEAFVLEPQFETYLETKWAYPISLNDKKNIENSINTILELAYQLQISFNDIYIAKSILFLIKSLLCLMIKETESNEREINSKENRKYIIEEQFNKLLKANFKNWKSPSQYAGQLSISVSHLNDTINELTQSSVSKHIQNLSILEAKRQLYFTDRSIKEIGYEVGYEDPVYFGKLFKKITNTTPLQFRKQFRD